jgi:MOSC domain-containing protein YiiM
MTHSVDGVDGVDGKVMDGVVVAVSSDREHRFSKPTTAEITLLEGLGVAGDAHAGVTVQHRSRVRIDPTQPNLRQVHLIQAELHDELAGRGFEVGPGGMGENITTRGLDLLALPQRTVLRLGDEAVVEVTGLRNPCLQLNGLQSGLMKAVLDRDDEGRLIRRAGIMGVVLSGGPVRSGDQVVVELPNEPHAPLEPV